MKDPVNLRRVVLKYMWKRLFVLDNFLLPSISLFCWEEKFHLFCFFVFVFFFFIYFLKKGETSRVKLPFIIIISPQECQAVVIHWHSCLLNIILSSNIIQERRFNKLYRVFQPHGGVSWPSDFFAFLTFLCVCVFCVLKIKNKKLLLNFFPPELFIK